MTENKEEKISFFSRLKTRYIPEKRKGKVFMMISIALVVLGYMYFLLNKEYYTNIYDDGTPYFALKKFVFTSFIFVVLLILVFFRNRFSDKVNFIINLVMLEAVPFAAFVAIEYLNDTKFLNVNFIFVVLNLMIILSVMGVGFIITGRMKMGYVFGVIVVAVFGIMNYFIYMFRGIPLLASDFRSLTTAANVAGNYEFYLNYRAFIFLVACFGICLVVSKLKEVRLKGIFPRLKVTGVLAVSVCLILVFSVFTNTFGIEIKTFRPMKGYHNNGAVLTLVGSVRKLIVEKPENYSAETAKTIAEKYEKEFGDNVSKEKNNGGKKEEQAQDTQKDDGEADAKTEVIASEKTPNMIIVMDEAFADVGAVGTGLATNKEVMPFFKSLEENTIRGESYVSFFGGGTANSEFEFLTGNSMAYLPEGATPYQLFLNDYMPSLNNILEKQGYQGNMAFHSFEANGYSRSTAYEYLKFEDFISIEDVAEELSYVRGLATDKSHFNKIINLYEKYDKKSDAPFYMFNVTMQNHSPFNISDPAMDMDIEVTTDLLPAEEGSNKEVDRYLNLINMSDEALGELITYFRGVDEPTVVVFFGDHQPRLPEALYKRLLGGNDTQLTAESLMQKYSAPFVIWANYDIPEEKDVKISMNYLSSYMLDSLDMEMTDYNKFLMRLHDRVPVVTAFGFWGSDGVFYENQQDILAGSNPNPETVQQVMTSPFDADLEEYKIMQYNNMFDVKNRVKDFFYLK